MHNTEGIVLIRVDVGEADAIFTIYTKDFGKMRMKAQGVKKDGAKLRGHLETLSHTNLSFVIGKSGERLTGATLINFWPEIRRDFSKTAAACFIGDLIDKNCMNGEKDNKLWELLTGALGELEKNSSGSFNAEDFLNTFEGRFSETQGYSGGGGLSGWAISGARPFGL